VKPLEVETLVDLIKERLSQPVSIKLRIAESAADILERNVGTIVNAWYGRVTAEARITQIALSREERTAHLPTLLHELISRLRPPRKANSSGSPAGVLQGTLRHTQGYTAHMLVMESRILQVSLFEVLHHNLSSVDFSLILLDVMAIADEVDFQLEQTIETYLEQRKRSEAEDVEDVA